MPAHEKIRQRRRALGLTLQELSTLLRPYLPGLSKGDLSYIENGKRNVLADEIPIFARVLQCRPEDLLDSSPE